MVTGASQVRPPSVERDERRACVPVGLRRERLMKWAVPSGAMETQGSEAREKRALGSAQVEKAGVARVQVRPPSKEAAETSPLAPPSDQRSCCQTPMR